MCTDAPTARKCDAETRLKLSLKRTKARVRAYYSLSLPESFNIKINHTTCDAVVPILGTYPPRFLQFYSGLRLKALSTGYSQPYNRALNRSYNLPAAIPIILDIISLENSPSLGSFPK